MILVPFFDLKFLREFAAGGVGTSNRKAALERVPVNTIQIPSS
jgi:hypothetical protein